MRAAKEMVAKVESQGGSDNTSIIIICLNQVDIIFLYVAILLNIFIILLIYIYFLFYFF